MKAAHFYPSQTTGPVYQTASRRTPQDSSSTIPFSVLITNLTSLQCITSTLDQSMAAAFTPQDYQLVLFGGRVSRKPEVTVKVLQQPSLL